MLNEGMENMEKESIPVGCVTTDLPTVHGHQMLVPTGGPQRHPMTNTRERTIKNPSKGCVSN